MTEGGWQAVAQAVKARRLSLRLTQKKAAIAAGVSDTTWGSIENARADSYGEASLFGICRALRWTIDSIELILGGGEPNEIPDGVTYRTVPNGDPEDTVVILERVGDLVGELTKRAREGRL